MNAHDLIGLSPLIATSLTAVVLMLAIAVRRSHDLSAGIALVGLAIAMGFALSLRKFAPAPITALLILDNFGIFYMVLTFATTFLVVLMCHGYFARHAGCPEEFYVLLLLSATGAATMVISRHFAAFYLGLEVLSVSLYAMIGYLRDTPHSTEAGLKYLILAAAGAAFLLFGMALVYVEVGTMDLGAIVTAVVSQGRTPTMVFGFALMIVGLGFKLSIVPFHMWAPDVYEGAPAPVTAYLATVSKGAVLALFLRYFTAFNDPSYGSLEFVISLLAVASMFVGNLLALFQNNVKRLLAYSSIAHLGYVLVAYLVGGAAAVQAVTYYLVAYFLTTLGAFGVVTALSTDNPHREEDDIEDYHGLFWAHPWLAGVFTIMLLSLAGIPLTAGFIGKFYVFKAGVQGALWWQVAAVVVNSAIGIYYYLRVAVVLYAPVPSGRPARPATRFPAMGNVALGAVTLALLWAGIYPEPLARWIQSLSPVILH